jgi:hypothetical protein
MFKDKRISLLTSNLVLHVQHCLTCFYDDHVRLYVYKYKYFTRFQQHKKQINKWNLVTQTIQDAAPSLTQCR